MRAQSQVHMKIAKAMSGFANESNDPNSPKQRYTRAFNPKHAVVYLRATAEDNKMHLTSENGPGMREASLRRKIARQTPLILTPELLLL